MSEESSTNYAITMEEEEVEWSEEEDDDEAEEETETVSFWVEGEGCW